MNLLDIIGIAAMLLIVFASYKTYTYEIKLKSEIEELDKQLTQMETHRSQLSKQLFKQEFSPAQLIDLKKRANIVRSCFQCPLYLSTVQEDTKQTIQ